MTDKASTDFDDLDSDTMDGLESAVFAAAYGTAFALLVHKETVEKGQNPVDWAYGRDGYKSNLEEADDHASGVATLAAAAVRNSRVDYEDDGQPEQTKGTET